MTRSARDARERRWVWLLRAVGILLVAVVLNNLAMIGSTLWSYSGFGGSAAPTVESAANETPLPPGAYHSACAEFRPSMASRMQAVVQQMLPAKLVGSEAELPSCQRCGDRIERGSQIWIASGH